MLGLGANGGSGGCGLGDGRGPGAGGGGLSGVIRLNLDAVRSFLDGAREVKGRADVEDEAPVVTAAGPPLLPVRRRPRSGMPPCPPAGCAPPQPSRTPMDVAAAPEVRNAFSSPLLPVVQSPAAPATRLADPANRQLGNAFSPAPQPARKDQQDLVGPPPPLQASCDDLTVTDAELEQLRVMEEAATQRRQNPVAMDQPAGSNRAGTLPREDEDDWCMSSQAAAAVASAARAEPAHESRGRGLLGHSLDSGGGATVAVDADEIASMPTARDGRGTPVGLADGDGEEEVVDLVDSLSDEDMNLNQQVRDAPAVSPPRPVLPETPSTRRPRRVSLVPQNPRSARLAGEDDVVADEEEDDLEEPICTFGRAGGSDEDDAPRSRLRQPVRTPASTAPASRRISILNTSAIGSTPNGVAASTARLSAATAARVPLSSDAPPPPRLAARVVLRLRPPHRPPYLVVRALRLLRPPRHLPHLAVGALWRLPPPLHPLLPAALAVWRLYPHRLQHRCPLRRRALPLRARCWKSSWRPLGTARCKLAGRSCRRALMMPLSWR